MAGNRSRSQLRSHRQIDCHDGLSDKVRRHLMSTYYLRGLSVIELIVHKAVIRVGVHPQLGKRLAKN